MKTNTKINIILITLIGIILLALICDNIYIPSSEVKHHQEAIINIGAETIHIGVEQYFLNRDMWITIVSTEGVTYKTTSHNVLLYTLYQ